MIPDQRLKVAIVFGGRSAEHEVSLQSAENIIAALDTKQFDPVLIGIDREGRWFHSDDSISLLRSSDKLLSLNVENNLQVALTPDGIDRSILSKNSLAQISKVDVLFPVLHGPFGEDGSIQGLAKLANLPCVGSDIIGSAIGMDKDVAKRLLRDAGIDISPFVAFTSPDEAVRNFHAVRNLLGEDMFIKPANMGSSVGVTHATSIEQYYEGVGKAFEFDTKIIVEKTIKGREIEVAVLGNKNPIASEAGEIVSNSDYYSYESKYINEDGAALIIPAHLDKILKKRFHAIALKTYEVLCCKGMARVDFFLDKRKIYVNEINTIPGFTAVSMYPKLWEASGISYQDLISRLIELAIEEFREKQKLKTKPV